MLLAVGICTLNLLMSIATMAMLFFWLIDPEIKTNLSRLTWHNPSTWMIGLFLIHIIWLVNTSDFSYAAKDLRIKLPLLVLAISLGTVKVSRQDLIKVWAALGLGIVIASLVGYYLYLSEPLVKMDPRMMVPDISHIRLGLVISVYVVGVIHFWSDLKPKWKVPAAISLINALFFLFLLQSLTALVVLTVGLATVVLFKVSFLQSRKVKVVASVSIAAFLVLAGIVFFFSYSHYYSLSKDALPLLKQTKYGSAFNHYDTLQIENGNYVYANIAEIEMVEAWNNRSDSIINYDPDDNSDLYYRLIRYLTSLGLTKDREGVESLTEQHVDQIEMGYPSDIYVDKTGLPLRFQVFLHGTHLFLTKGYFQGSSFYQRSVYWSVGISIALENFWTGVGTGDVKSSFKRAYQDWPVFVEERYRLRSHNQYITFCVTFGVFGLLYFVAMLLWMLKKWHQNWLYLFFTIAAILSFLTEDTLETQAGVTFFAFFLSLFSAGVNAKLND
jgi:hypothetical protein